MALLTPSSVYTESLGSLTLLIFNITIGTTSDTVSLGTSAAVVDFWFEPNAAIVAPYTSWSQTTGLITIANSSGTGAATLFVLVRQ